MRLSACGCILVLLWPATGFGAAPRGRYTFPTDKIVRDSFTRIDWERYATRVGSAQEAIAHCAGLTLAGTGWRVPTVAELHTIVDPTRRAPAIDIDAFPMTEWADSAFYSSTPVRGQTNGARVLGVNFTSGTDVAVQSEAGNVRCVRYWAAP